MNKKVLILFNTINKMNKTSKKGRTRQTLWGGSTDANSQGLSGAPFRGGLLQSLL